MAHIHEPHPFGLMPGLNGGDNGENSISFNGDGTFAIPMMEESDSWTRSDGYEGNDGGESPYGDGSNGNDDDSDSHSHSDCESVISSSASVAPQVQQRRVGHSGLVLLGEGDRMGEIVKNRFVSGLRILGVNVQVEGIHRNLFTANSMTLARVQCFQNFRKAVETKNGGGAIANLKYGWFGASKDEIEKVILHGFDYGNIEKNGAFGYGLYLNADNFPLESLQSSTADDEGTKRILLCRILAGKLEAINPGSTQCRPSSEEFQTGVDNLSSPRKFIVWSTHLNTHVLPEFLISFKTVPCLAAPPTLGLRVAPPTSTWMSFPALLAALSKILPREAMQEIAKYHHKYKDHKISRRDVIEKIRELAGDGLLMKLLKAFREKQLNQFKTLVQLNQLKTSASTAN